jgi:hypothetical protein
MSRHNTGPFWIGFVTSITLTITTKVLSDHMKNIKIPKLSKLSKNTGK